MVRYVKHFEKSGGKFVTCKSCKKAYAYHTGMSNLHKHLQCAHPSEVKEQQQQQQSTLSTILTRTICSDSRAKRISELIADMVAHDLQPTAMALLQYLEPGYQIPSAVHIAQLVQRKHKIGKQLLKKCGAYQSNKSRESKPHRGGY